MQKGLRVMVMALVILGTLAVLTLKTPEAKSFVSDDGLLTLSGSFASSDAVSIGLVADGYQLYPPTAHFVPPAMLTYSYASKVSDVDAPRLRLSVFDNDFRMWRPLYTTVNPEMHTAEAEVDQAGTIAPLVIADVARPNFDAEIESLVAAPPIGAVGYAIEVGYATSPGEFVMLNGSGVSGGCAHQYKTGESTQMTSRGAVFSDNLEYNIVAVWQIGSGCSGYETIE